MLYVNGFQKLARESMLITFVEAHEKATAETLNISTQAISGIAKLLHPILPYSTAELFVNLGFDSTDIGKNWSRDNVPEGTHLAKPKALYSKLESE